MRIKCITTFHDGGLICYGQRFIDSWAKNVDPAVELVVYAEDCIPVVPPDANIKVINAKEVLPKLNAFKERHKDDPKANGICPPEIKARRPKDWHKEQRWDAVRFANKTYTVFEAAKDPETDILVWIDGDTYVHSPITYKQFRNLVPESQWLHYLGRKNKWPECGWYGLTLRTPGCDAFLKEFERVYEEADDGIFKMEEWHDSYVFGQVLKRIRIQYPNIKDFSGHLINGDGHPLINCELGAFFDHLKSEDAKITGKSENRELIQPRSEAYWNEEGK
jgi:hypothetical protein